jgi:hypothetical protein
MDVPFDLSLTFKNEPIQRLDKTVLKWITPRKNPGVQKAIDQIGALSAEDQGLKRPLTTYDKLLESEDEQVLYVNWAKNSEKPSSSVIYGILKVSHRKLYLNNAENVSFMTSPLSVLDFYVHPSVRKSGHGQSLFDFMLEDQQSTAAKCAFDKPSDSLLEFLEKRYGLTKPIWQTTRFVVFPNFFDDLQPTEISTSNSVRPPTSGRRPKSVHVSTPPVTFQQRSPRPESVGGIIHGDMPLPHRAAAPPDTPQGRKNTRDFGHQSIW